MKRNSLIKGIAVSVALSAILAGCGSGTTASGDNDKKSDEVQATTISGKAVDGYLQYATVCLDLSQDGYCQEGEPTTQTSDNGSFELQIQPQIQKIDGFDEAMLLVYGGKDVDTGADFRGKLLAPADAKVVNASPISTLVAKAVQKELKADRKLTKEEMKEKIEASKERIAKIFGINKEDILKDPVAEKVRNPKLIKEALKIQKAVEAMSGASEDNEKLEEIYEKLVQHLEQAEDAKGMDSLLAKAYKDDPRLADAKNISKNIEKSFKKFEVDLDLGKVAFIIKEDLKKIKQQKPVDEILDEDDRFKIGHDWDMAYIKSGLEDIGIDNPSLEQIEKIKADFTDINPRVILENIKKFEDSEDEILKEIHEKIKKSQDRQKEKEEIDRAKYDGQIFKFEKGMTLFDFDTDYGDAEYTEIKLGEDNVLSIKDFEFNGQQFEQDLESEDDFKGYKFKDGAWVVDEDSDELNYRLDDKGVMTLPEIGYEITLLNQKDISGDKRRSVVMPEGSKISYLKVKQLNDEYELDREVFRGDRTYGSISEYINHMCEIKYFTTNAGTSCDENTKEGKSREGKWNIKTLSGDVEVLVQKSYYQDDGEANIYASMNGKLYNGWFNPKGVERDPEPYFNKVAMDAIKKAITDGDVSIDRPVTIYPIKSDNGFDRDDLIENGKIIYKKCAGCHGAAGEKKALGKNAIINNNSEEEIVSFLEAYKRGERNEYTMGSLMRGQVANLTTEDIKSVAAYIKSL